MAQETPEPCNLNESARPSKKRKTPNEQNTSLDIVTQFIPSESSTDGQVYYFRNEDIWNAVRHVDKNCISLCRSGKLEESINKIQDYWFKERETDKNIAPSDLATLKALFMVCRARKYYHTNNPKDALISLENAESQIN